jgi:DNA-nicking Smr family endonuclease
MFLTQQPNLQLPLSIRSKPLGTEPPTIEKMNETDPVAVLEIEECIDLHGFQPKEIPQVVQSYLEAAREKGFHEVRLIHGRGIGVQRARVHSLLRRLDYVLQFHEAPAHLGGWGATVVRMRPLPP